MDIVSGNELYVTNASFVITQGSSQLNVPLTDAGPDALGALAMSFAGPTMQFGPGGGISLQFP